MENILIIGLGNPGVKYARDRHNFGFMVLDQFAENKGLNFNENKKFKSIIAEFKIGERKIILAKPQTFMNDSGIASKKLANFYKPELILAIYDDLNLNLGAIRLRENGESGGHNGVKSLIQNIGTNFWRLKLGIGPQTPKLKSEDFVLQNFKPKEIESVNKVINESADLILKILEEDLEPRTINL